MSLQDRRLAADGTAYTYLEFVQWYGAHAGQMWVTSEARTRNHTPQSSEFEDCCSVAAATEHSELSVNAVERHTTAQSLPMHRWHCHGAACTATEHAATAALPAATAAATAATRTATKHAHQAEALMQTSRSVQITVESSVSGEQIFGPLRIQRTQSTSSLLRQLQHIAYTEHQSALLVRLTFDDCLLDSSRPVMQYHAATEHMDVESEPKVVFKMIAEPLLLTWEQLFAMPAMRKRAGRGGKAACLKQRELRAFCFENNIARVDLARSAYNWRLLLKTIPCLNTPDVIGPGIVGFSFCLLSEIDPNYAAERHVFELTCANGDRWHLHFHQRGNCDRRHLPWSRDNAEPASASERRLSADGAAATELPSACVRACVRA
jgi:hypothetical protein